MNARRMRIDRGAAAALTASLIVTGCGGSSSTDSSTASLKPLPKSACSLLTRAEVSRFLGKVPKCGAIRDTTPEQDVVGAAWMTPRDGTSVKVGVLRTKRAETKETFEREAGTKSNGGAKPVGGIGDDAVLVSEPRSATSGSIWILHGNDIIIVMVTGGKLTGDALEKALTATGRRLLASY
jgi:hypothetical protein